MKITQGKRIILLPEDGYILTNNEVYSDMVFLGIYASPSDWHEIKLEEVPQNERIFIENSISITKPI